MKVLGRQKRDKAIMTNILKSSYENMLLVPRDEDREELIDQFDLDLDSQKRIITYGEYIKLDKEDLDQFKKVIVDDVSEWVGLTLKNIEVLAMSI